MGAPTKITTTTIKAVDTVKVYDAQADEVQKCDDSVVAAARPYDTQADANAKQMGFGKMLVNITFVTGFRFELDLCNKGEVNLWECAHHFVRISASLLIRQCHFPKDPSSVHQKIVGWASLPKIYWRYRDREENL